MSACPSSETLQRLLVDGLGETECARIESHVEGCHACQDTLEMLCTKDGAEQWRRWWREEDFNYGERLQRLGRYRVLEELGSGGFGTVYRCYDTRLQREVALKVPHASRLVRAGDVAKYLAEAQVLASLDHPHIVPVYDFGTSEGLCFLSTKFIRGSDLARRMRERKLAHAECASIIASAAEALHHAHQKGLYHRDVKPSNILIDGEGKAYVADFGLAVREEELGGGARYGGTPPYASPEQARGEGHLVDGRTDVYSLGVVLYELLAGRRPFEAKSKRELFEQIITREARPPRQIDEGIPAELERICLKALAKRAADRYSTARDLADDLRRWLEPAPTPSGTRAPSEPSVPSVPSVAGVPGAPRIIPKGLRSFDAGDTDFFLDLLPGPRDRDGLPESIRFWKRRMEEGDAGKTFRVGLILGPSGCGKSSLVNAGLLPRLGRHVTAVYVEATAQETEARLLQRLRERCARLRGELDLIETLKAVRRGQGMEVGQKVVIVLDQFEQWLHGNAEPQGSLLVRSLRQCDGGRLQCVMLVRDDFALAAYRFMRELETRIVEGENCAIVDLFDREHARKVLGAFGRAYGKLPAREEETPGAQQVFLDQAVDELSENGRVVPVRLAVFAEMVKHKPWIAETMRVVGGAEGIGSAFLDESFSAPGANPAHRVHERAARGVLQALLPEEGLEIRGHRRRYSDLMSLSGYGDRPERFGELLEILDSELRLLTPSEGEERAEGASDGAESGEKSYQLTHDYLVPSIRAWLTRKQKETWRGRAELCLEERTAQWSRSRQRRFLPSSLEYLRIAAGVPHKRRKAEQQSLMRAAGRHHGLRWGSVLVGLAAASLIAWFYVGGIREDRMEDAVQMLMTAAPEEVPYAIERLKPFGEAALGRLRKDYVDSGVGRQRLRAALALAQFGEVHDEDLVGSIASASDSEFGNIVAALEPARDRVFPRLRAAVTDAGEQGNFERQARYAGAALYLREAAPAQGMLALDEDPTDRTAFIHAFGAWRGDFSELAETVAAREDAALQCGIATALGLVDRNSLNTVEQEALEGLLVELYSTASDGGTHSAAGWALGQWGVELPPIEPGESAPQGRGWFVNGSGMTMIEIPLAEEGFLMQSPWGAGARHVRLTRRFAMCDREVWVDLFRQFVEDPDPMVEKPRNWPGADARRSPAGDCPVQRVNWFDAVLFCNWLSRKEGRQPCYTRTAERQVLETEEGPVEFDVWRCDFGADGYRLPTEAEWEYACRSGSATRYSFGEDSQSFVRYGICALNSKLRTWPAGTVLPNGWGLYDMHGNTVEWCWDWYEEQPGGEIDPEGPATGARRVVRGGHWLDIDLLRCTSGYRQFQSPDARGEVFGFRVLRGLRGKGRAEGRRG